jgi:RNA polymerase sigma-70 factor (ECF subfamily)
VNKRAQAASVAPNASPSGTAVDDRELVDAARAGDKSAFRTLFERYQRRAYSLAYGVVRNPDDALDVVQDAFIKAHRYLDKFEGTSSFYTWLYRIVMNLAIDHIRKTRRSRAVDFSDQTVKEDDARVGEGDLVPRILGGNPGRALMDKEIRGRIEQALSELSDNHRAVLVMRELEGLSYEEMAQVMGCSKGTIMSRLFHARRNMQKRLLDLYDHPPAELIAELEGKANGKRKSAAGADATEAEAEEDEESAAEVETSGAPAVKGTTT